MPYSRCKNFLEQALHEDCSGVDWTSSVLSNETYQAKIIAKQSMVFCGRGLVETLAQMLDIDCGLEKDDGELVAQSEAFVWLKGPTHSLSRFERVALNLVGRLSGISTLTRLYVSALSGYKTELLDTRKTTPLYRNFEKHAFHCGGGRNHRFQLSDGVLVKENHIRMFSGSLEDLAKAYRERVPPGLKLEIETTNMAEVEAAVAAGFDIIMFDNFDDELLKEAVDYCKDFPVVTEASGRMTIDRLERVAQSGVDYISTSAPIIQAGSADLSMLVDF